MKIVVVKLSLLYVSVIVISLMFTSQSFAKIDPKTIGGMWLFDEGQGDIAKDSSGNGNNGKLKNGPKWVKGKFDEALSFGGPNSNNCVLAPDSKSLSMTKNMTLIRHLDERNKRRNDGVMYMMDGIDACKGLYSVRPPAYIFRGYYGLPYVRYATEELGGLPKAKFLAALRAEGAGVSSGAPGGHGHLQAIFRERNHPAFTRPEVKREVKYEEGDLPNSENPRQDLFTIPAFPTPSNQLLDQYIEAFKKVTENAEELLE